MEDKQKTGIGTWLTIVFAIFLVVLSLFFRITGAYSFTGENILESVLFLFFSLAFYVIVSIIYKKKKP